MGLYAKHVFPRLMDYVMAGPRFQRLRAEALESVSGRVLEIGFGTGLNLPHYPKSVSWLTGVEPGGMLPDRVAERTKDLSMPVQVFRYDAESLPWAEESFDCVVSTWTLCSIRDVGRALQEVRRVLKSDGRLIFLEHGRSEDPSTARWQDLLTPIQRIVGCGCHLNRPIDALIARAGFTVMTLDRFVMEGAPRLAGEMYRGIAGVTR